MDGDFRSQTAWMPSWLRPDRLETPKYILLVKSDFEKRLETILYTVPVPAPPPAIKPSRPAATAPEQIATTTNTALLPANVSDPVGSYVNPYLNYKI